MMAVFLTLLYRGCFTLSPRVERRMRRLLNVPEPEDPWAPWQDLGGES